MNGLELKMGWLLTGDSFPKKWRVAWAKAWKQIETQTGVDTIPTDAPEDVQLDLFRWAVKLAESESGFTNKQMENIRKQGLPEIFERPTRSFESVTSLVFQISTYGKISGTIEFIREVEMLAQEAYMDWYLDGHDTIDEFSALIEECNRLAKHGIVSDVDYGRVTLNP